MSPSDIINEAYRLRLNHRLKGGTEGKYIIGAEYHDLLRSSDYYSKGIVTDREIQGYPYVVDYTDKFCINFCPIGD